MIRTEKGLTCLLPWQSETVLQWHRQRWDRPSSSNSVTRYFSPSVIFYISHCFFQMRNFTKPPWTGSSASPPVNASIVCAPSAFAFILIPCKTGKRFYYCEQNPHANIASYHMVVDLVRYKPCVSCPKYVEESLQVYTSSLQLSLSCWRQAIYSTM